MTAGAVTAYIALGANLGDAAQAVRDAMARIAALPGTQLRKQSRLYATQPVDATGPDFVNAVVEVATSLQPHDLLAALQQIENDAGRARPYRNAPRTLDLDVLLYGDERIADAALTIPHPRMSERAFVLVPLAEIAPHLVSRAQLAAVRDQRIAPLPAT